MDSGYCQECGQGQVRGHHETCRHYQEPVTIYLSTQQREVIARLIRSGFFGDGKMAVVEQLFGRALRSALTELNAIQEAGAALHPRALEATTGAVFQCERCRRHFWLCSGEVAPGYVGEVVTIAKTCAECNQ